MNRPEHYAEAERLLAMQVSVEPADQGAVIALHAAAQAHATLALAAAVAEGYASGLVRKPVAADVFGDPDPGSPWGEVLYPLEREAMRRAKVAVLDMLDQTAQEALTLSGWAETREDHDDAMTQALADNQLRDSLARQWHLQRRQR